MAKYFNSVTGQFEDDGKSIFDLGPQPDKQGYIGRSLGYIPNTVNPSIPIDAADVALASLNLEPKKTPVVQQGIDPVVKDYLLKKAKPQVEDDTEDAPDLPIPAVNKTPNLLDQFSPEKYKQALGEMKQRQSDMALAQLAAGLGDALARRDSSSTDRYFQDLRQNIQDQTVGEFNRQKANAIADVKTKQQLDALDPNSADSQRFRKLVESTMPNIAKAYGDNWGMVTAGDSKDILDYGKMRETIDARRQQYQLQQQLRNDNRSADAYQKASSDMEHYRGNQAAQQAATALQNAQNALALANVPGKGRQMLELLAAEMGKLATGGVPGHSEIQAMMPNTAASKLSEITSFLLNKPTDAQADEFVKQQKVYLKELINNYQGGLNRYKQNILDGYKYKLNPTQLQDLKGRIDSNSASNVENKFPMQVRKDGHVAIVKNEQELKEAQGEGWQ